MSLNQVCIIDGDYDVTACKHGADDKNDQLSDKLTRLIESYKAKLQLNSDTSASIIADHHMDTSNGSADYSKFVLIHSKDGSELYTNLLQSFGLNTSDLDSTLSSGVDTTMSTVVSTTNTAGSSTASKPQQRTHNSNYTTFVCFLISDFDQNDKVFVKLEETQLKLSNFLNALNMSASSSLTTSASQKRFMIFGWPVLHYCLENNLVSREYSHSLSIFPYISIRRAAWSVKIWLNFYREILF